MDIRKHHLQQAVERQIISEQQSDALWQLWQSQQSTVPQFSLNHVLYYLGGLLAIGAMTLFMTLGWETFGGSAIVALCLLYGLPGVVLTEYFHKRGLAIPAGICAVLWWCWCRWRCTACSRRWVCGCAISSTAITVGATGAG